MCPEFVSLDLQFHLVLLSLLFVAFSSADEDEDEWLSELLELLSDEDFPCLSASVVAGVEKSRL